jgi:hypothetical protein
MIALWVAGAHPFLVRLLKEEVSHGEIEGLASDRAGHSG